MTEIKSVYPKVTLIRPANSMEGIDCLRTIEANARISHRSEEKQTLDSWERFIRNVVLDHGDWSVVEHASASATFHVNRGITHELVRHRLFSFTQESTRFVNYDKKGYEAVYIPSVKVLPEHREEWEEDLQAIDATYRRWLGRGYAPQIARDFLPNALGAVISVTANLRNWRHLLVMRTTKETHPDFKVVTLPLLMEFKIRVPLLFDDIEPEQKQSLNMRLPR